MDGVLVPRAVASPIFFHRPNQGCRFSNVFLGKKYAHYFYSRLGLGLELAMTASIRNYHE